MSGEPINYLGTPNLLTNPLYTKWSKVTIGQAKAGVADLKEDLDGIMGIYDNIEIISYLSTLLRAVALTS